MTQREHIQELVKNYRPKGFDLYVETHRETENGLEYSEWEKYGNQETVDERSIFPNEIIIDVDAETTEKAREETRKITALLETRGMPFFTAYTGGTGFHVHIFFQYTGINWKELRPYRKALYNWLKATAEENHVNTDLWDDGMVDFEAELSKGHLVRAVGGRKQETGYRKTVVTSSQLEKKQVTDLEKVQFPEQIDFIRINKVEESVDGISWKQVQEKAEQIKQEQEDKRKESLESTYEAESDGLNALRNIPAHEVLKEFYGMDVEPGNNFYCVVHGSDGTGPKEAKVMDGSEPDIDNGLYGCFGDSCRENGESVHLHNAIDLLVEGKGMEFQDAKQELAETFDVEITEGTEGTEPGDYFKNPETKFKFQPNKLAKDIEQDHEFIYNKMQEQLYYYKNGVYKDDGARLVKEECNKRLGNEFKRSRVNDTLEAIKTRPGVAKTKKEFRPPEYKINFENGVYDLIEGELKPHSKEYYFTYQIPHKYNPEAEGTKIQEFFQEITETKEEARTLMQLSGYSMLPNMPISAAFLLVGSGSNGKTMFLNTLKQLIGPENAKDENLQHLENTRFGTASLYRKLVVVSDDLPGTRLERGDTLKAITGGGMVRAEWKGGDHFEFENYATPVFACNEVPETKDQTDGFFRRWTIIDFPYEFTENPESKYEKERKSEFQLRKELFDDKEQEAYAYQSVKALEQVLEKQKFASQVPAEETRQKWNGYASPLMEFIYNYIEQGVTYNEAERKAKQREDEQTGITSYDFDYIPKDELFGLVSAYAEARNARPPNSKTELKKKLDKADLYFSTARTTQTEFEDGQTQIYRGIRYSDEFQELLEKSESLQEFQGFLKIPRGCKHTHALANIEMKLEKNPANPARIDEVSDSPQIQIVKAFDELDAVGDQSIFRQASEIEEETDLDSEEFDETFEDMNSAGLIVEQEAGKFYLSKKAFPEEVEA